MGTAVLGTVWAAGALLAAAASDRAVAVPSNAEQARVLEQELASEPAALAVRAALVRHYAGLAPASEEERRLLLGHVLWLIRNRPETEIAGSREARFDPLVDAEAYLPAEALWVEQIRSRGNDEAVFENALRFFDLAGPLRHRAADQLWQSRELSADAPERFSLMGHLYLAELPVPLAAVHQRMAARALWHFERALIGSQSCPMTLTWAARAALEAGDPARARTYALDVLAWPPAPWERDDILHWVHVVLGRVALRDRDKAGAKEHLLAAGHVAKGGTVSSFGPNMRLARELLLAGERGVVLQYLRLCAQFWPSGEDELQLWTAAVEEGRIPDFGANLDY